MKEESPKEWFETWFDSPYYHILYKNRSQSEAIDFIELLGKKLRFSQNHAITDLACGKGRHSLAIAELFQSHVLGLDLSVNSINAAQKTNNTHCEFAVHDMRNSWTIASQDFVLNLFTSFGYFALQRQQLSVLKSCHKALKKNGILVIDYLNANAIEFESKFWKKETQTIDSIEFSIEKKILENKVIKKINIIDGATNLMFQEQVALISIEEFEKLLLTCGFNIKAIFGDYKLNPFTELSPRLILIAQKC